MKYRLICLAVVAVILAGGFVLQGDRSATKRYHQHLEERPYTPCSDHGDEVFCTHLPLFNIVTDVPIPEPFFQDEEGYHLMDENGNRIINNEMVTASVDFFVNPEGNNHLTDAPELSERALIRFRGNSSRSFEKKSYLLKFTTADGSKNLDVPLDGMAADNSWVLHGPILDKTLIRNYLCYNITGEFMDYVPEVRFCELYLNGQYEGVYLLTEKINYNSEGRCKLTKTDPKLPQTSFLLRLDKESDDSLHSMETFLDYNGKRGVSSRIGGHFEILYHSTTLTPEQKEYISSQISNLEKAMSSFDATDKKKGYAAYLDVDSFVDYFIFNEFCMNNDVGKLSTYLCRDIRGKITIIGWDYNNVFNNYSKDQLRNSEFIFSDIWYEYLFRDSSFVDKVVQRYRQLRKGVLSDAYLENYIAQTIAYLGPAVQRNNTRWGYTFSWTYHVQNPDTALDPLSRNPVTYQGAVDQLVSAIEKHGWFLDENIEMLYSRSHASVNKKYHYQSGK